MYGYIGNYFVNLRLGYRGLDTASVYDNEKEVGQAIKGNIF